MKPRTALALFTFLLGCGIAPILFFGLMACDSSRRTIIHNVDGDTLIITVEHGRHCPPPFIDSGVCTHHIHGDSLK